MNWRKISNVTFAIYLFFTNVNWTDIIRHFTVKFINTNVAFVQRNLNMKFILENTWKGFIRNWRTINVHNVLKHFSIHKDWKYILELCTILRRNTLKKMMLNLLQISCKIWLPSEKMKNNFWTQIIPFQKVTCILIKLINRPSGEEIGFYSWWYIKISWNRRNIRPPGEE